MLLLQNVRNVHFRLWLTPAICLLLSVASPLSAADSARFGTMKDAMAALATHIKKTLEEQGLNSIAVQTFDGPAGTSASSRIGQALSDQLKAQGGIEVSSAGGSWSVAGKYSAKINKVSNKLEVLIQSELKDQLGSEHTTLLTPIITDEQETMTLFGVSADLPVQTPPAAAPAGGVTATTVSLDKARTQAVVNAIVKPQVAINEGLIKASVDSPFGIEVLIGGQPVPAEDRNGAAFVTIQKEQVYEVRLINDSDMEVGVTLTIDGVNTLEFSQNLGYRELGKWVIGPRSTGRITGWHDIGNKSHSFLVTDYANSAAAKLSATKDIGTITAVFCAAFTGDPPPDEPTRSKGGLATGFGPPVEQKVVDVQRKFGVPRGSISVRYDKPETELPPAEIPPGEPIVAK